MKLYLILLKEIKKMIEKLKKFLRLKKKMVKKKSRRQYNLKSVVNQMISNKKRS